MLTRFVNSLKLATITDSVCWIPGRLNLADPGTKPDNHLGHALPLLLFIGRLPFGFPGKEAI